MKLNVTVKGVTHLQRALKAQRKSEVKALESAIKKEGFLLMKGLKGNIKAGITTGPEKSMIARRLSKSSKLLRRLATAVRYQVRHDPFTVEIGWVGPKVSKSWKRIAYRQQEGFTSTVTDRQRAFFRGIGGGMSRRGKYRRYFFLKKSTTTMKTPARPILDPFWESSQERAWRNISTIYKLKLSGQWKRD